MELIEAYQQQIGLDIDKVGKLLRDIIRLQVNHFSMQWRLKAERRIIEKIKYRQEKSIFKLRDIYAFRILVRSITEAYTVYNLLRKLFSINDVKDYLIHYKPVIGHEGYGHQALQLTAQLNHCQFEIQITTPKMHDLNESMHEEYIRHKYSIRRSTDENEIFSGITSTLRSEPRRESSQSTGLVIPARSAICGSDLCW